MEVAKNAVKMIIVPEQMINVIVRAISVWGVEKMKSVNLTLVVGWRVIPVLGIMNVVVH